jgi:hypothetical protein
VRALALVLIALFLGPLDAGAQSARVLVRVRGPGAGSIERAVGRALAPHGYEMVTGRRREASLRVDGRVRARGGGKRRRLSVSLEVRRANGQVVGRLRVRGVSAQVAVERVEAELWPAIVASVSDAAPEPEPVAEVRVEPEPRPEPPPREPVARVEVEAQAEPAPIDDPAGWRWLSLSVGPELYGRHYSYRDDIFEVLRAYDLTATPALTATAEVYPVADRPGALAGLGLAGRFTHVPRFDTEDVAGSRYESKAQSYVAGARYRLHLARVEVAGALDYGSQTFSIAPVADAPDPDFPDARYRYLRAGIGAAAPLWSGLGVAAGIGYRQVLASGEIEDDDFFPRSSARGIDAELELSYALMLGFDVRAGAALERYGHDLDPEPGDPRVAGGALDQYPRFYVRLGFTR